MSAPTQLLQEGTEFKGQELRAEKGKENYDIVQPIDVGINNSSLKNSYMEEGLKTPSICLDINPENNHNGHCNMLKSYLSLIRNSESL